MRHRREFLYGLGTSLGSIAFSAMLADDARADGKQSPLAPKDGHLFSWMRRWENYADFWRQLASIKAPFWCSNRIMAAWMVSWG